MLLTVAGILGAQQQFADLGDFELDNGAVIRDCRIGFRTLGRLDSERSNAVLWPTWFGGESADLLRFVAQEGYVDPDRFFVVLVDALGNGVSSSPSNSAAQAGAAFPQFSIRDMVRSQRRLLAERLGLDRLHAVIGISMGGMQTYEWITAYPAMMSRAVAVVGSPRLGAYDAMQWRSQVFGIELAYRLHPDEPAEARRIAARFTTAFQRLNLTTPAEINRTLAADEAEATLERLAAESIEGLDPLDRASQLRAMLSQDVAARFGGSLEEAARQVEARTLTVVSAEDHLVTPQAALEFAADLGSPEAVLLTGDCGHLAPVSCAYDEAASAIRRFLEQ